MGQLVANKRHFRAITCAPVKRPSRATLGFVAPRSCDVSRWIFYESDKAIVINAGDVCFTPMTDIIS
jgi:hypothetical protein